MELIIAVISENMSVTKMKTLEQKVEVRSVHH